MEPVLYTHCRRHDRKPIWSRAELRLVAGDGRELDHGTALVADMSLGGARLVELELAGGSLPLASFRIRFRMTEGEYSGIDGIGRPVRWDFGIEPSVGLELEDLFVDASDR